MRKTGNTVGFGGESTPPSGGQTQYGIFITPKMIFQGLAVLAALAVLALVVNYAQNYIVSEDPITAKTGDLSGSNDPSLSGGDPSGNNEYSGYYGENTETTPEPTEVTTSFERKIKTVVVVKDIDGNILSPSALIVSDVAYNSDSYALTGYVKSGTNEAWPSSWINFYNGNGDALSGANVNIPSNSKKAVAFYQYLGSDTRIIEPFKLEFKLRDLTKE